MSSPKGDNSAYLSGLTGHPDIDLLASSGDTSQESLVGAAATLKPDVILLGTRVLRAATAEVLEALREVCPGVAVVLLSASYDSNGIRALRETARGSSSGYAYLFKHTIDTVEQLTQLIAWVAGGRVIVDPALMAGLISSEQGYSSVLKGLSPRELEVLSWIAKGYRNSIIAKLLYLEPKTVERHVNSIYKKLGAYQESRHPRVQAVKLYFMAAGIMPQEHAALDSEEGAFSR